MVLSETDGKTYKYNADKIVTVLLPLQKDPNKNVSRIFRSPAGQIEEPTHIASDDYQDIFILAQSDKYEEVKYNTKCNLIVWVKHNENGERYQENRSLNFVFFDEIPDSVKHSVAEDFFFRLNAASQSCQDAIGFLMKALVIYRDLPENCGIKFIDIKFERVDEKEQLIIPTSKEIESDEEVEDLVVGHVQTALEHAYPNALPFETIVEQLRSTPELINEYLSELISKGIAEQLETGEYIRVNTFAKAAESKLSKSAENSPTIAIICSLFLENLAISRIIENASTVHMYNLSGDSNVYTIGNIGPHRVVLTKLSMIGDSREATTSAGSITTRLLGNFQNIEHVLICGVAGGVPHFSDPNQHVQLGDVVLSSTRNGASPAYVYGNDIVKDRITGRVTGLTSRKFSPKEEKFIELLNSRGSEIQKSWMKYSEELIKKLNEEKTENYDFTRPSTDVDVIALHTDEGDAIVSQHPSDRTQPVVHEGTVASMIRYAPPISLDETETPIKQPSSQVLRNAFLREYNAKAFDNGFASVIDSIKGNCIDSYLLIRGVADYHNGTSKISKQWQPFASANVASLTKTLIEMLPK